MSARKPRGPAVEDTRERLKVAAQRLMAERGVDGVSIRAIVEAAGQRNMASLHYYFRTKEGLIQELVVDAARLMEGRRKVALEALQASGAPIAIRDLVNVLVMGAVVDDDDDRSATILRFLTSLYPNHRHLFEQAIGARWNTTYQACLDLIRERATGMPRKVLDRRLLFASISMLHLLAARESARAAGGRARTYWSAPDMIDSIVDAVHGMLSTPVAVPARPPRIRPVRRDDNAPSRKAALPA